MNTVCAMCPKVLTVRIKTVHGYVCAECYKSHVMYTQPHPVVVRAQVRTLTQDKIDEIVYVAVSETMEAVS